MTAYLFLWNPKKDKQSFREYERVCADASQGQPYETPWICPSKQPGNGDIAFLQRTGDKNNGIFAKGVITRSAFNVRGTQVVDLRLDKFLPLNGEIPRSEIVAASGYERPWTPMASGNVIPDLIYQAIQLLWEGRSAVINSSLVAANGDERADELLGLEGEALLRMVTHRKRERALREQKIMYAQRCSGRLICEVPGCGFDFERVYGAVGAGYAQVHHRHPLAKYPGTRATSLADLAVVCCNSHAMIHRNGECRDLNTLIPPRKR